MINRQKLWVLGIFWLAGVLAGLVSLAMSHYVEVWVWGDLFSRHWGFPSDSVKTLRVVLQVWVGALVVGSCLAVTGVAMGKWELLSRISIRGIHRVAGAVVLFSLNPIILVGLAYLRLEFGLRADPIFNEWNSVAYILAFCVMVMVVFPKFVFLGYGLRIATDAVPGMQSKVMLLAFLGYVILASAFMGVLYALVLTTSEFMYDQWAGTGFIGRLAVLDGAGLSFILWYWLMFPEGFLGTGKIA